MHCLGKQKYQPLEHGIFLRRLDLLVDELNDLDSTL